MASRSISSRRAQPSSQHPAIHRANGLGQVFGSQCCPFAKNQRAFDGIFQFTNIARPVVSLERLPSCIAERHSLASVDCRQPRQHMLRQRHDIRAALA